MDIKYFAAVDEHYNFPLEIREQLTRSEELKHLIVPMSDVLKKSLNSDELWDGRTIYNITKQALEVWKASLNKWVLCLDSEYTPPSPPKPWDIAYRLPKKVRDRLAVSDDFRFKVSVLSKTQRDSISPEHLWNGRTIFNTTSKHHEVWLESDKIWRVILDETIYIPPRLETTWQPGGAELLCGGQKLNYTYNVVHYLLQEKKITLYFYAKLSRYTVQPPSNTQITFRLSSFPSNVYIASGGMCIGDFYYSKQPDMVNEESVILSGNGYAVLKGGSQDVELLTVSSHRGGLSPLTDDIVYPMNSIFVNGCITFPSA